MNQTNAKYEEDLLDLVCSSGDDNLRHLINYSKGANYFFTNVKQGNVSELYEKVCHIYEIHPALQSEFDKARQGVEKSFEIQQMLKERFGFTQKKYFRDKKGLMNLIYGEQPNGYYSAKTYSFALLFNLPKNVFKENSKGFISSYGPATLEKINLSHDLLSAGNDYIPSLDALCIKYNAFDKSSVNRSCFFNLLNEIGVIDKITYEHELKHIIDGMFSKLHTSECFEFTAGLYSEGPIKKQLRRDIDQLREEEEELSKIEIGSFDDKNNPLLEDIEALENFPFDLLGKIRNQGLSHRDLSFLISLYNAFDVGQLLEDTHDYLSKNPINTKNND